MEMWEATSINKHVGIIFFSNKASPHFVMMQPASKTIDQTEDRFFLTLPAKKFENQFDTKINANLHIFCQFLGAFSRMCNSFTRVELLTIRIVINHKY